MTSRYRRLPMNIWIDRAFIALSNEAKLVFLHAWSTPNGSPFGLFRVALCTLSDEIGWKPKRFLKFFNECVQKGFIKYDEPNRVLFLPSFLTHNPPPNPKVVIGWQRICSEIPDGPLKDEFLNDLRELTSAKGEETTGSGWLQIPFHPVAKVDTVTDTVSHTVSHTASNSVAVAVAVTGVCKPPPSASLKPKPKPKPKQRPKRSWSADTKKVMGAWETERDSRGKKEAIPFVGNAWISGMSAIQALLMPKDPEQEPEPLERLLRAAKFLWDYEFCKEKSCLPAVAFCAKVYPGLVEAMEKAARGPAVVPGAPPPPPVFTPEEEKVREVFRRAGIHATSPQVKEAVATWPIAEIADAAHVLQLKNFSTVRTYLQERAHG